MKILFNSKVITHMPVCDLGTEIFIRIIRTIHVISERKPALLTNWLLMRTAQAMKSTNEIGKKIYIYTCLYWILLFDLGGKFTEAKWCSRVNKAHGNSEINEHWFDWERFHIKGVGRELSSEQINQRKDLDVFGERCAGQSLGQGNHDLVWCMNLLASSVEDRWKKVSKKTSTCTGLPGDKSITFVMFAC